MESEWALGSLASCVLLNKSTNPPEPQLAHL